MSVILRHICSALLFATAATFTASAYEPVVNVTVECDETAEVGDTLNVQYTLDYNETAIVDNYKPQFIIVNTATPAYVVTGLSQTMADSTPAIANPDGMKHFTDTFVTTLRVQNPQDFNTPAYMIVCGTDTLSAPVQQQAVAVSGAQSVGDKKDKKAPRPNIVIIPSLDKTTVEFGQPVTVTYWLDSNAEITGVSTKKDTQLFVEAKQLHYDADMKTENVDGMTHYRCCVGKFELVTTDVGTYKTPILNVNVAYRLRVQEADGTKKTYVGEEKLKSKRTTYKVTRPKK